MWMEVHIHSVKANSQAGNISVKDIMTAARDHKNLYISPENSAGESAAGVTYISMTIHPKRCYIFPLKVFATLLNGSRKGQLDLSSHIVKVGVKATC